MSDKLLVGVRDSENRAARLGDGRDVALCLHRRATGLDLPSTRYGCARDAPRIGWRSHLGQQLARAARLLVSAVADGRLVPMVSR